MYMPPAAMVQAIIAPKGPVAVAKVLGREKIPAPTIDPTTIAVNVQKENFCTDARAGVCSGAGENFCSDGAEYFRCADPMLASRPHRNPHSSDADRSMLQAFFIFSSLVF